MTILRWQTSRRYYCATIQPDLFGGMVLMTCWGGRGTNLGGMAEMPVEDMKTARAALHEIGQRREQHKYQLVSGTVSVSRLMRNVLPRAEVRGSIPKPSAAQPACDPAG